MLRNVVDHGIIISLFVQFKLAMSLMKLAFSLESWDACGGDGELTGEDALREGNDHIDTALTIFKEVCMKTLEYLCLTLFTVY